MLQPSIVQYDEIKATGNPYTYTGRVKLFKDEQRVITTFLLTDGSSGYNPGTDLMLMHEGRVVTTIKAEDIRDANIYMTSEGGWALKLIIRVNK